MSNLICSRCKNVGNAKHIDSYGECERCTLKDIQTKNKSKETISASKE